MIKISIFGHSPESFCDAKSLSYDIDNAIAIIKRQHKEEKDFIFFLSCEPGASQWFCNALMEQELPYEIFLHSTPENVSKHWSNEQQQHFAWQMNKSKAIHICGSNIENRNQKIIDESQCVLVFWNGKHQGFTYNAIKYALLNNKIIYNGIGPLKLIDNNTIKVSENNERL